MSKYKKTWLPIAIILVLAALILLLAMIGSKFSDDSEELNESPEPSAEVTPTPPPTPTPTPEPTPAPTPVPKKVNNTVKENTRTEEKEADKSDWEKFGEQVGKGMKDARENFENGMKEINGHKCWDSDGLFASIKAGMKKCAELGKIPSSMGIDTPADLEQAIQYLKSQNQI